MEDRRWDSVAFGKEGLDLNSAKRAAPSWLGNLDPVAPPATGLKSSNTSNN
jgi:hypothetical protein